MATPIPTNQAVVDARWIANASGGSITCIAGREYASCRGVTTDSRQASPGCAFVALRGDRQDGHDFLKAAIASGAKLVVVERGRSPDAPGTDVVEVNDTLAAWGAIARAHLRRWRGERKDGRTVAITGSAGKTTTKELCAAILGSAGPSHATSGNLNNRVGLPAVALGVEAKHRFVVFEMGMSVCGEIAALADIAEPDVGLITNIALAHAGGVGGTLADVAREKGALFAAIGRGTLIANADDASVMALAAARLPTRSEGPLPPPTGGPDSAAETALVTFGRSSHAQVRLVSREPAVDRSTVLVARAGRLASFEVPIAGEAAALDFVAALAAAEALAGPLDDAAVASALRSLPPLPGRMCVRRIGGVIVLDDAYNANPASMRAALQTLSESSSSRKIAVLGEMRELGADAEREHESLGDAVAATGVDLLVSCGGLADAIARTAARRGVRVVLASDAEHAGLIVRDRLRPGDAVLIKASRSVGAERAVETIAAWAARAPGPAREGQGGGER
jgi:UDP-N-acetylmuramoyl-tripeptide--D-alanyl-D-alanine ligase